MNSIYGNRTTPFFAFLEGMVRVFDWGAILALRKGRTIHETEAEKEEWSKQTVDRYIRGAISAFESEEAGKLAGEPMLPRHSFAIADILLGPLSVQEIILRYEMIIPGASEKIMDLASRKLDQDSKAELKLLDERGKQGYMGMAAGFALALLLTLSALYMAYSGHPWAAIFIVGINISIVVSVSVYISKARVRQKLYDREFFFRSRRSS